MSIENNAISGDQIINENPDILKKVEPSSELQEWLVDYVGTKHAPDDGIVTVEMILQTMSEEFPEFLLPLAEENFVRGYKQALEDAEQGRRALEEAQAELEEKNKDV